MLKKKKFFRPEIDGVLRCSRYAFGPNRLHYCGPDANQEILSYIKDGVRDHGIEALLQQFRTMYPYLCYIARANKINDPFDKRVIEAYWLGNELLERIEKQSFYRHLQEDHKIKSRIGSKLFNILTQKISGGALPHHSFHVFNIWKRTGYTEDAHTIESMNECRVSSGEVCDINGPWIIVKTRPFVYLSGKLALALHIKRKITRSLASDIEIDEMKIGDIISIHWGVPCEIITPAQARALEYYTLRSINLANEGV